MPRLSVSGLSILLALGLALWEWFFFFHADTAPGWFASNRIGMDLAWIAFIYLAFQLVSIPFAMEASRARFIGVLDGMASLVPLGIALVAIFGKPEYLDTPEKWEAAFLLLCITAADLLGGYAINIALSRRMMDVAAPVAA
jgi:hypothetical protein